VFFNTKGNRRGVFTGKAIPIRFEEKMHSELVKDIVKFTAVEQDLLL